MELFFKIYGIMLRDKQGLKLLHNGFWLTQSQSTANGKKAINLRKTLISVSPSYLFIYFCWESVWHIENTFIDDMKLHKFSKRIWHDW